MFNYLLDTNILLALMISSDNLHKPAKDHVDSLFSLQMRMFTVLPCIQELSYLIGPKNTGIPEIQSRSAMDHLLHREYGITLVCLTAQEVVTAHNSWMTKTIYGKNKKLIDLADYYLVHAAKKISATIVTADDDIMVLNYALQFALEIDPITLPSHHKNGRR